MKIKHKNTDQGKGLVLVLDRLAAAAPKKLKSKTNYEASVDYCCSALVLSSAFGFRVVPDRTYHLYLAGTDWKLSLVSPKEWGTRSPGHYVGGCKLRFDMTWSIAFDENMRKGSAVHSALLSCLEDIKDQLYDSGSWVEVLKQVRGPMPYQQRVLATAFTASLRHSLALSGQVGLSPQAPQLI